MIVLRILKNIYFYIIYVLDRLLMSCSTKTLYSFPQWLEDKYELKLKENSFIRVTAFLTTYLLVSFTGWIVTICIYVLITVFIFIINLIERK